jgi:hypothetical protein
VVGRRTNRPFDALSASCLPADRLDDAHAARPPEKELRRSPSLNLYGQFGNLNDAIQVLQLPGPPVFGLYSVAYQKVQSSAGSIESAL